MRTRLARGVALLAAGAAALMALRVALFEPLPVYGRPPDDGYVRVPAVVHVHTTLSDGGGTPEEVIAAAAETGVAVLGITDHNNLDAKPHEGYHDGVLVLVGSELSTPRGHLLGVGLERDPAFRFAGDALDALEDVRQLGGVAFAAHPLSPRPDLRFRAFDLPGPWGMELLNGDSDARAAGPRLLLPVLLYRLSPDYALQATAGSMGPVLARWDELLAERDAPGLAGADAHSRLALTRRYALRFPAYRALFRQARNHLLLDEPLSGDAVADRRTVLDALAAGRFYIGRDALAPAGGFAFAVEDDEGRSYTMGDHVPPAGELRARVGGLVPEDTRVTLLRDGRAVGEGPAPFELRLAGPGVYRVEARVPGWPLPWVVTNPVYVFDPATLETRRMRGAWPAPPEPPRETAALSFASDPPFSPEHDPLSRADLAVLPGEGPAGPDSGAALRLEFRLAPRTPAQPFTWCALVDREPRDLASWSGLRFFLRGDGEYRLWVQLRDPNPASADDGLEWWLASARTSLAWQEVRLPFERFRTINPRSDGSLDTAQVRAIVLVLDHATVKEGTEGRIWVSRFEAYR